MPAILSFDEGHTFAFDGPRQNHCGLARRPPRALERVENRRHLVTVDDDRMPAECAPAAFELLHIVRPHCRPALTQGVDIGDPAQIVEAGGGRRVRRFPDRAFRGFAVAEQHICPIRRSNPAGVQRHADRRTDALTERAGRDVDERQPRRRMPFQIGIEAAQLEQFTAIEGAGLGPCGIQNRRGMTLRQHEAIGIRVVRIARVKPHLGEEEGRHDVGH